MMMTLLLLLLLWWWCDPQCFLGMISNYCRPAMGAPSHPHPGISLIADEQSHITQ